jgi:hypothetical protein
LLIAAGTPAGLLFAVVWLIESATRPGYKARTQQTNFIIFGVLVRCSTLGWHHALAPSLSRSGSGRASVGRLGAA